MPFYILAPLYFFAAKLLFYRVRDLKETRSLCPQNLRKHKGGWISCSII
jgi:hypothetical protein